MTTILIWGPVRVCYKAAEQKKRQVRNSRQRDNVSWCVRSHITQALRRLKQERNRMVGYFRMSFVGLVIFPVEFLSFISFLKRTLGRNGSKDEICLYHTLLFSVRTQSSSSCTAWYPFTFPVRRWYFQAAGFEVTSAETDLVSSFLCNNESLSHDPSDTEHCNEQTRQWITLFT